MFQRCSVMLVRCNIILLLSSWCSAVFINPMSELICIVINLMVLETTKLIIYSLSDSI